MHEVGNYINDSRWVSTHNDKVYALELEVRERLTSCTLPLLLNTIALDRPCCCAIRLWASSTNLISQDAVHLAESFRGQSTLDAAR